MSLSTHRHSYQTHVYVVLLLLPEDIKVSPKMRPAKALSKRGGVKVRIRHVVRDTVARLLARSFVPALVHSYAKALKQSCTQAHTHPFTRTHPRSDNKCRANKASSLRHSLPQGVSVCVCVRVLGLPRPPPGSSACERTSNTL